MAIEKNLLKCVQQWYLPFIVTTPMTQTKTFVLCFCLFSSSFIHKRIFFINLCIRRRKQVKCWTSLRKRFKKQVNWNPLDSLLTQRASQIESYPFYSNLDKKLDCFTNQFPLLKEFLKGEKTSVYWKFIETYMFYDNRFVVDYLHIFRS